jgi:hypothetical protein
MADGYPDNCPECGASLEADGGFSRVIGISDGDQITAWQCPDCQHCWRRTEPPVAGLRRCAIIFPATMD